MNIKDFLDQLETELKKIETHSLLTQELLTAMQKSGNEVSFLARLIHLLKVLNELGVLATQQNGFEPLKGSSGVYSMRILNGRYNIRILYKFFPNRTPVLLHAFYERAGHNNGNYTGHAKIANQRFEELKEER